MTREHKLALIIGFSLVLLVGVVISDHFSKARTDQLGEQSQAGGPTNLGAPPTGLNPNTLNTSDTLVRGTSTPSTQQPHTIFMGSRTGVPDPASGQMNPTGAEGAAPDFLGNGVGNTLLRDGEFERGPGRASDENKPAAPDETTVSPEIKQAVGRHEVKEGETLYAIAKKYYGNGGVWKELAAYNKGRVNADGSVRAGVSLMIPSKKILTGKDDPAAPAPILPGVTRPKSTQVAGGADEKLGIEAVKTKKTYTVKQGETLGDIAQKTLGTSRKWKTLLDANKSVISDPESLRPGMVLTIPSSV